MFRGLTTISFYASDLAAAKAWYSELLGIAPYFEREGYIEFRIGDYQHELGIIDSRYAPPGAATGPAGAVAFWHVDDITASYERVLTLGATPYLPIREFGAGFTGGAVIDPFGNILGLMYNPHYLEMLQQLTTA